MNSRRRLLGVSAFLLFLSCGTASADALGEGLGLGGGWKDGEQGQQGAGPEHGSLQDDYLRVVRVGTSAGNSPDHSSFRIFH